MPKDSSANYYKKDSKKTSWKMKVILKRKREKKGYGCKRYKNLPEKKKQKLDEYKKNITKWKKNASL